MKTINCPKWLSITAFLFVVFTIGSAWLNLPWLSHANAEDQNKVRSFKGLKFNVPDDWPIEERGGAVGPIPIEEYIAKKFSAIDSKFVEAEGKLINVKMRLDDIESRLDNAEKTSSDIETRLNDLEQWLKHGQARQLN